FRWRCCSSSCTRPCSSRSASTCPPSSSACAGSCPWRGSPASAARSRPNGRTSCRRPSPHLSGGPERAHDRGRADDGGGGKDEPEQDDAGEEPHTAQTGGHERG